jgi:primosomal protein N' (replication factor Y)
LIEVAVNLPLPKTFTYHLPASLADAVKIGMRVLVSFGRKTLTGFVVGFPDEAPCAEIKDVSDLLDEEPLFGENDLQFYQWVANYYYYPLGQTIAAALPQGISAAYQQIISLTDAGRDSLLNGTASEQHLTILRALENEAELPSKKLEKIIGRRTLHYQLSSLERKGLLQITSTRTRKGTQIKKEKYFSVNAGVAAEALKGKQLELYQFFKEQGAVPMSRITARFKNSASILRALQQKSLIRIMEKEVLRRPALEEEVFPEPLHTATPEQEKILERLLKGIEERSFFPFLLHGVTGSGKTEIYLRVMDELMKQGRQCLLLVPEIALTAQLWDRVCSRIDVPVSMLHSSLTSAERFDAWRMIRRGEIKIVIGARSAIFASFADLGAIIIDEEHDPSYKQDVHPRYSARDLALIRGKMSNAMVILGSATPSLESYHNAAKKKYSLGSLPGRIEDRPMPQIKVIDLRITSADPKSRQQGIISAQLREAIARRLQNGEQSLLFLNRRGFAPVFLCQQCGYTFRCPNCDVSLIHHQQEKKLRCHYCDFALPLPESCPDCKSFFLTSLGWGTERLEREVNALFPKARVARMDRDSTAAKGATRNLLKSIVRGELDILVGTQMIAKGHHLPQVTLVGVVCADHSLNFPDYRAGERTFQLLTQVAGRAGRGDKPGEVFIQTYNPEHYSILCAQQHDYRAFFAVEMKHRRELGYPPHTRMINFRLEGANKERLFQYAQDLGETSKKFLAQLKLAGTVNILGPAPAPWGKIKGKYRYQMLLKSEKLQSVRLLASRILQHAHESTGRSGISLSVDVDPVFIL